MKIILILIVLLIARVTTHAQSGPVEIGPSNYLQLAQAQTAVLTKQLSLDTGQADSVLQIYKNYYRQISGLRSQKPDVGERGKRLRLLEDQRVNHLQNTLSATQYKKLQEDEERIKKRVDSVRLSHQQH